MFGAAALLATTAIGASALVIPHPVSLAQPPREISSLPPPDHKRQSIRVPCPSCPSLAFAEQINNILVDDQEQGARPPISSQHVVLDFAISPDGEELLLNGESIFHVYADRRLSSVTFGSAAPIYVEQALEEEEEEEEISSGDALPSSLHVTHSVLAIEDLQPVSLSGDALIPLTYSIQELDDQEMTVGDVEIVLLRTSDGELLIAQTRNVAASGSSSPPPGLAVTHDDTAPPHGHITFAHPPLARPSEADACAYLPNPLCRLKHTILAKFPSSHRPSRQGGCHGRINAGKLPGHIKPHHFLAHGHDDMPRLVETPHHHGRHHGRHGVFRAVMHVFSAVLVPVLGGITIGGACALICLLLGRFFQRAGNRCRSSSSSSLHRNSSPCESLYDVKHVIVEEDESDEETESLPGYEEAPAYEVIEGKK